MSLVHFQMKGRDPQNLADLIQRSNSCPNRVPKALCALLHRRRHLHRSAVVWTHVACNHPLLYNCCTQKQTTAKALVVWMTVYWQIRFGIVRTQISSHLDERRTCWVSHSSQFANNLRPHVLFPGRLCANSAGWYIITDLAKHNCVFLFVNCFVQQRYFEVPAAS